MKVVIVDGDVSYPPTAGKRLRTLHLMLRLARRHQITYIARGNGDPAVASRARGYLKDHGIEAVIVDDPIPKKSGPGFYARLVSNLFSPLPYSVASFEMARMQQAVGDHAARNQVDLWHLEWLPYLHLPPPGAAKVMATQNVESQLWQRHFLAERHPLKRWYIRNQWRKFERFERAILAEATRVVAVSREDAEILRHDFHVAQVDIVENGIDGAAYDGLHAERDPWRMLFLGSLDWRPNQDAVKLLLDRIFPEIYAQEHRVRLTIVGRHPPPALVRRIRRTDGVELRADVDDVRPYLAESAVMAVPLRIGGGSRLKILESLAAGLPVVSTRLGAEGLRLEPGKHLRVVETADEMSGALLDTLRNFDAAICQAERGRLFVREHYDWDRLAGEMEKVWESCMDDRSDARRRGATKPEGRTSVVVHLMSSAFFGGPERQMLGLALGLPKNYRSVFLLFAEGGRSRAFLEQLRAHGIEAIVLDANFPRIGRAVREIAGHLARLGAEVLCTSGYKPDIIGWLAARRGGVPVVSISHGWTAATWRVRCYEALDRRLLRCMDAVVAVSRSQAERIRRTGVRPERLAVIPNAVSPHWGSPRNPDDRGRLQAYFADPPEFIVGAAGRLSREKGFGELVKAAGRLVSVRADIGFVLFGDGPLREDLRRQAAAVGLDGQFVFAGLRTDLDRLIPQLDLLVLPSYTEGLPVVLLESLAAGVPVVATEVGGTPELVEDGVQGYLVPPGDSATLATRIADVLADARKREAMGRRGRARVRELFNSAAQAAAYERLFARVARASAPK